MYCSAKGNIGIRNEPVNLLHSEVLFFSIVVISLHLNNVDIRSVGPLGVIFLVGEQEWAFMNYFIDLVKVKYFVC